jgi:hypothetical protein
MSSCILEDESRWTATVFSVAEVERLMKLWAGTDEALGGRYFWVSDGLIVRDPGIDSMTDVIAGLIGNGEFSKIFQSVINEGLADPGRSEQGGIRLVLDERQGGEVLDLARVEVGLEGEVVLVERLVVRPAGRAAGPGGSGDRRGRRGPRTGPGRGSRGSPSFRRLSPTKRQSVEQRALTHQQLSLFIFHPYGRRCGP